MIAIIIAWIIKFIVIDIGCIIKINVDLEIINIVVKILMQRIVYIKY